MDKSTGAQARFIAVLGARGGVGASGLAASVARALRDEGARCVLMDLRFGGPGLEVLLGVEGEPGARWPEMVDARGDVDGESLAHAVPQWESVPVLSVTRASPEIPSDPVILDVAAGLLRGGHSVVADLPGPAAWTPALRALLADADQVLVVATDTTVGLAGAVAVTGALATMPGGGARSLAIRSRRGSRVAAADATELTKWPVLARYLPDRHYDIGIELGAGPLAKANKRLARAGRQVAQAVAR